MVSLYKVLWEFFGIYFHIFYVAHPNGVDILAKSVVSNSDSGNGNPWVGFQVFIVTCHWALEHEEFMYRSFLTGNISNSPRVFLSNNQVLDEYTV